MTTVKDNASLTLYMNSAIKALIRQVAGSILLGPRQLAFIVRAAFSQNRAARMRRKHETKGMHIPPILIASITSQCNLFCTGCYARANQSCDPDKEAQAMSPKRWGAVFREAESIGVSFALLAGGEPLLAEEILNKAAECRKIIFPVFTNGILLDEPYARYFARHRNLIPVISIEGGAVETDSRRGKGTHRRIMEAMKRLKKNRVFFGVSMTVCSSNYEKVTSPEFCNDLINAGCRLIFFVEYVPFVESDTLEVLSDEDSVHYSDALTLLRSRYRNLLLIDFIGGEKNTGGCVAAGRGFFHINSSGGAEPCPFSPYSDTNLVENNLIDAIQSPLFKKLDEAGLLLGEHTGGCHLFEHEDEVRALVGE